MAPSALKVVSDSKSSARVVFQQQEAAAIDANACFVVGDLVEVIHVLFYVQYMGVRSP